MAYRVEFDRRAEREFHRLDQAMAQRLKHSIDGLAGEPRPRRSQRLQSRDPLYCIRAGNYRIVYFVDDIERLVLVLRVRHRGHAYRGIG